MIGTTTKQRELIHWLWLWMLVAIAVTVMQGIVAGQQTPERAAARPSIADKAGSADSGAPIPMPNVDHPEWFEYPESSPPEGVVPVGLNELLERQRAGNFKQALQGWQSVRMAADSVTWQEVGIGVAFLKIGRNDHALEHLEAALELNEKNAVAEYFLGRVRQAQGRQVPFWYESDQQAPFRLASIVESASVQGREFFDPQRGSRPKMFLPHFIDDAYDRLARLHFRRAITLAPECPLNCPIQLALTAPVVQLTSLGDHSQQAITVGDLLDSWGERDYVRRAKAELGLPRVNPSWDSGSAKSSEPQPLH